MRTPTVTSASPTPSRMRSGFQAPTIRGCFHCRPEPREAGERSGAPRSCGDAGALRVGGWRRCVGEERKIESRSAPDSTGCSVRTSRDERVELARQRVADIGPQSRPRDRPASAGHLRPRMPRSPTSSSRRSPATRPSRRPIRCSSRSRISWAWTTTPTCSKASSSTSLRHSAGADREQDRPQEGPDANAVTKSPLAPSKVLEVGCAR